MQVPFPEPSRRVAFLRDFTSNWIISDISNPLAEPHLQPMPLKMACASHAPPHLQNTSPTTVSSACENVVCS